MAARRTAQISAARWLGAFSLPNAHSPIFESQPVCKSNLPRVQVF
jgi:hypothetical protein